MKNLVIFLCILAYATATPGFTGFSGGPVFPGAAYPRILGSSPAMYPRINGGPYGISPGVAGPGAAYSPIVSSSPAVSLGPVIRGGSALYASGADIGTGVPGIYSTGSAAPRFIEAPAIYSTGSAPGIAYSGDARLAYTGSTGALSGLSYERSGSTLYTPRSAYSAYTSPAISGTIASAPAAYDLSGSARTVGLTTAPGRYSYGSFVNTGPAIYTANPAYSGTAALRVAGVEGTGGTSVYPGQAVTGVEYAGVYQPSATAVNRASLNSGLIAPANPANAGAGIAVRETSAGIIDASSGGAIVSAQRSGAISGGQLNGV